MKNTITQNFMEDSLPKCNMDGFVPISKMVESKEEEAVDFAKMVKKYADETITGMSEEDWEEFYRLCKEYLEKKPIRTEADLSVFQKYMKGILKRLGFKGDMDEFCENFYSELGKGEKDFDGLATASLDKTMKKIITETDGKKYLLVTTKSGQAFKIRISDGVEHRKEDEEALIET